MLVLLPKIVSVTKKTAHDYTRGNTESENPTNLYNSNTTVSWGSGDVLKYKASSMFRIVKIKQRSTIGSLLAVLSVENANPQFLQSVLI